NLRCDRQRTLDGRPEPKRLGDIHPLEEDSVSRSRGRTKTQALAREYACRAPVRLYIRSGLIAPTGLRTSNSRSRILRPGTIGSPGSVRRRVSSRGRAPRWPV